MGLIYIPHRRKSFISGGVFTNVYSLDLDGVDEYGVATDHSSLDITTAITVCCWVKFSANQSNKPLVAKWGTTDTSYLLSVQGAAGVKNRCGFAIADSSTTYSALTTASNQYNDSNWHMFMGTYDGSTVYADVDGGAERQSTSHTGSIDSTAEELCIGAYSTGHTNNYNAKIEEITIWDVAFNTTQRDELYNSGVPIDPAAHSLAGNLQAYFRCGDNDTHPTMTDNSSNSNDCTLSNTESADFNADVP